MCPIVFCIKTIGTIELSIVTVSIYIVTNEFQYLSNILLICHAYHSIYSLGLEPKYTKFNVIKAIFSLILTIFLSVSSHINKLISIFLFK